MRLTVKMKIANPVSDKNTTSEIFRVIHASLKSASVVLDRSMPKSSMSDSKTGTIVKLKKVASKTIAVRNNRGLRNSLRKRPLLETVRPSVQKPILTARSISVRETSESKDRESSGAQTAITSGRMTALS